MRNTSIAENIAAGRRELGITQAALAERVGVTKAAVSKWELGQSLPDVAMLPRLASQLGVTLDELIGYGQELSDEEVSTIDGNKDEIADAKDVLSKKGVTYKNIWFKSDSDAGKFTSNLFSFPTTYVIDQNGNIVGDPIVGAISSAEQRAALDKLIDQAIANSEQ